VTNGNITGMPAPLSGLSNFGGETYTHKPLPGNPAVDGGSLNGCMNAAFATLTTDQRGVARPLDGNSDKTPRCDIGAFEVDSPYHMVYLPIVNR